MATNPTPGLDITDVMNAAGKYSAQVSNQSSALQGIFNQEADLQTKNADLTQVIGDSAQIIEGVRQSAELKATQAKLKAANALGTNVADQSEVMTKLARDQGLAYEAMSQSEKVIREKQSGSFLENPISYIYNLLTVNDDIRAHNSYAREYSAAQEQMSNLNVVQQQIDKTQDELKESVTTASVDASLRGLAAKTSLDASRYSLEALKANAQGIQVIQQADTQQFQIRMSVFGAQKAQEAANESRARLALATEEFNWKKEQKKNGEADDNYLIGQINKGIALSGSTELLKPNSADARTALQLVKSNSPAGKQFQDYYQIAKRTELAGDVKTLAASPAQAVELLNTLPIKLTPAQEGIRNVLDQAVGQVLAAANMPGSQINLKDPASRAAAINKSAEALFSAQASKIDFTAQGNVYNILSPGEVIKQVPSLQSLPLVQKVLAPLIVSGTDLRNPDTLFATVAKGVKDKTISYDEALSLSMIIHAGTSLNMEARQFGALGITPNYGYRVPITTQQNLSFGRTEITNIADPVQLGRALNKYLASDAFGQQKDLTRELGRPGPF